jgi:hypothetical protein
MSDTTVAIIAAVIGAVVGSAGTGLVTWLVRWRDAQAELRRARSDAYLRFIESCSIAYALMEQSAELLREYRWWKDWPWWMEKTSLWLAKQLYGQVLEAVRQATGPYFAVCATGTPDAIERADRMFRLLQDASHLATEPPRSRKAQPDSDPQEWANLLARFAKEREAFLTNARKYLDADRR